MSLADIKNKLYKKEEEKDLYHHAESEFDARSSLAGSEEAVQKFSVANESSLIDPNEMYEKRKIKIKIAALIGGVILLLVIIGVVFYKIRQASFNFERVSLVAQGLEEVRSGKLVAYEITYKNDNRADLRNAVLRLSYPENFRPEENPNFVEETPITGTYNLGEIKGGEEKKIIFNARTYSASENLTYLKMELSYTPSVLSSILVTKSQYGVSIATAPITLNVLAQQVIANGDAVEYVINYRNSGNEELEALQIKADYADGFIFASSIPMVSDQNNIWFIGTIPAGEGGIIKVKGKMEGRKDEIKRFTVHAGIVRDEKFLSYIEQKAETRVAYPDLAIVQRINDSDKLFVNAGDILNYEIQFGNNSDQTLKDLIVSESIDSPILDYSTLSLGKGGYFDANRKIITWKAADNEKLARLNPGERGSIKFTIKVKDIIPTENVLDKNFIFSSSARIDSADINSPLRENQIISGNEITMKLNSKLVLESFGFYTNKAIPNSGPIPPVVGQDTTYTIYWRAMNIFNDVEEAKVIAVLPTNVTLTGNVSPENANYIYNERSNTLVWNIGNINAGAGITSQAEEFIFQVKLTPLPGQASNDAQLVGPATFSAKDLFTEQELKTTIREKTTYLTEDSTIPTGKIQAPE